MTSKKLFISLTLATATALGAVASPVLYSKDVAAGGDTEYGTGRAEDYYVAITLGPSFKGQKVTGVRLPLKSVEGISTPGAFLTTELKVESVDGTRRNVADVESVTARVEGNEIVAEFSIPYTIGDAGVNVGVSFTVSELTADNRKPLIGKNRPSEGGFSFYTSYTQRKWLDASTSYKFTSAMIVEIDGDYNANDIVPCKCATAFAARGKQFDISLPLTNLGGEPLQSLECVYSIAGQEKRATWESETPVRLIYGEERDIVLTLEAPDQTGAFDMTLAIEKVNGKENASADTKENSQVNLVSYVPVHRPLMEEFTGTWCGYCTRGIASMEHMNKNYPELFIGAAYHRSNTVPDPMENNCFTRPRIPETYPNSVLDRSLTMIDPYTGISKGEATTVVEAGFGFLDKWKKQCEVFAPCDVNVRAEWSDASEKEITVYADVEFVYNPGSRYGIDYILTGDGITSPDPEDDPWTQENSCRNYSILIPEIEQFSKGDMFLLNLVYDDVVLRNTVGGVEGSLPSEIRTDRNYRHTYKLEAGSIKGTTGCELIQNRDKLNVIACVVDKASGLVLNAAKCRVVKTGAGVETADVEKTIVAETYYDLGGRRVVNPVSGIYVKVTEYSDGTRGSRKTVVR